MHQPQSEEAQDVPEQQEEGGNGRGKGRRGGRSTGFDTVWRLAARGSAPPPSPLGIRGGIEKYGGPCPAAGRRPPVAIGPLLALPGCPPGPL